MPNEDRTEQLQRRRGLGVPEVPPGLDRAAALAWRALVVAAALWVVLYVLARLQVVVLPVFAALVVATVLVPPVSWLRDRGLRPALATAIAFLAAFAVAAGVVAVVVPPLTNQIGVLGVTLEAALEDIERWVVEDAPGNITQEEIDDAKAALGDAFDEAVSSVGQEAIIDGAMLAAELVAGLLIALVASFFLVKDGPVIQRWVLELSPPRRRPLLRRLAGRAWWTLGGYVRGTAIFGVIEATIFGVSMLILGADVILPVVAITLVAPFLPLVGGLLSGVVATLVVLVTAGTTEAVIMGIIAIVVHQFDNDVLNPLIYGRTVQLHPLVILAALTSGIALGGLLGAVIAVPVAAVIVNVIGEYRAAAAEAEELANGTAGADPPDE